MLDENLLTLPGQTTGVPILRTRAFIGDIIPPPWRAVPAFLLGTSLVYESIIQISKILITGHTGAKKCVSFCISFGQLVETRALKELILVISLTKVKTPTF